MALRAFGFALALSLASFAFGQAPTDIPTPRREARAVWVATVGNIDWPSRRGLSIEKQRSEAEAILDRAVRLNMNIVILQVRPASDAIYPSSLAPWSPYLCGSMGEDPGYDPLAFWIDQAHRRGIELHAWFNPYRALSAASVGVSDDHVSQVRPEMVRSFGDQLWLDPGMPDVQKLLLDSVIEVVERYDVDGIHFDDYFYPYPLAGESFQDQVSYDQYLSTGGGMAKGDWRRSNVDGMVYDVATAIKTRKPWVKFGVSPFGIWRPGYPAGVSGLDAYTTLSADSRKWLQEGWVDYLAPQLYWATTSAKQNYGALLKWWTKQNTLGRHIWPGNYTSKLNNGWPAKEILSQIAVTRGWAGGNIHFSAKALMANYKGIATALRTGPYSGCALAPASPWLDAEAPLAPAAPTAEEMPGNGVRLTLGEVVGEPVRFYIVATSYNGVWSYRFTSPAKPVVEVAGSSSKGTLQRLAVAAIDRTENLSEWTVVALPIRPGSVVGR